MSEKTAQQITTQRIIQQQRELLYWEESTIRDSLCQTISSTLQHLFTSSSLDLCLLLSSEMLLHHRFFTFFEFEELQRNISISDIEHIEFKNNIDLSSKILLVEIDERDTRRSVFDEIILAKEHPSMILELHHQFLCEMYESDLEQLRSARDVKLQEQQCVVLMEQETASRHEITTQEHSIWSIDLFFISFSETKSRLAIQLDQQDMRENQWTCPICAVIRPAKNSMLAEINSSHPIRGEDMLQMHLLHHAADVTRRRTIRNATLKEEFQDRMKLAFSAFSHLISMNYEYRRGILLMSEEQTRYKKFEDPAAWRAGIRAAIEATRRRQQGERETIEYRELMKRLELGEESERMIQQDIIFGMEILDSKGDFLLQRRKVATTTTATNDEEEVEEYQQNNNNADTSYLSIDEYGGSIAENNFEEDNTNNRSSSSNSSSYSVICRNNIDTIWKLFEERLSNQRPLVESDRVLSLEDAIKELLPSLPIEASHVRRKMGTDESVSEVDRFLFGSGGSHNINSITSTSRGGGKSPSS